MKTVPQQKNNIFSGMVNKLTKALADAYHQHIFLPVYYRRLRNKVVKRREVLNRVVRITLEFDERTANTIYKLMLNNFVLVSTIDTEQNIKNLANNAKALRVRNRHNINYQNL